MNIAGFWRGPIPIFVLAIVLGLAVFACTDIAYTIVESRALPGYEPVGLVSLAMDINSYYSFIHQAAEGHFFFRNNMTSEPCDAAFINVQWWLVGRFMDAFNWSPLQTFVAWRFVGALMLMIGLACLIYVTLTKPSQRVIALFMCAFGGGFGWVLGILGSFHIVDTKSTFGLRNAAMDLITAIHPFGQMMKNPHYSLPHGTFALFITCFVIGEKTRKAYWYVAAAGIAVVQGLFRPYDTITICAMAPLFIGIEFLINRKFNLRETLLRALPMITSLPLLGYYFYIFSVHPVFSYWAEQGKQPAPSFIWHTLGLGLAGMLFLYRLAKWKRYPFDTSWERLLLVLTGTILFLYHGNHITSLLNFSPQIGIPLIPPMIILGLAVLPDLAERFQKYKPSTRLAAAVTFILINAASSPLYVVWNANIGAIEPRNYVRSAHREAIDWLIQRADSDDVILASELIGSQISFLHPQRVAMGHWALTPNVKTLKKKFERFQEGDMSSKKAAEFIDEIKPEYIYITDPEDAAAPNYFKKCAGAVQVFANEEVVVYQVAEKITSGKRANRPAES